MISELSPVRGAGFLSLLSVPRVAAPFRRPPSSETIARLRGEGLEIAEVRLDLAEIQNEESARELIAAVSPLPSVLTIRPTWEGGGFSENEKTRHDLFCRLLPKVSAADIELAAEIRPQIIAAAKKCGAAIIVSKHNFCATDSPQTLDEMAQRAFAEGADIFKYAGAVNNENDFTVLQTFLQKTHPVIVIGMGDSEFAKRTRTEFPAQGSRIAFAAAEETSAPGQLNLRDTVAALRRPSARE